MPQKEGRSPSYTEKPPGAPGCPFSAALRPALHPVPCIHVLLSLWAGISHSSSQLETHKSRLNKMSAHSATVST